MSKKLDGREHEVRRRLDPQGLGRVNVRVEIGAGGQVSAAMTFDNPQAAAELRPAPTSCAGLWPHAGFDSGSGGLSFDVAGEGAGEGEGGRNTGWGDGDPAGAVRRPRLHQAAELASHTPGGVRRRLRQPADRSLRAWTCGS